MLRIIGALVRTSLMTAMQYRSEFLFDGVTGLLGTAATVAGLLLVFVHRDEVAGWDLPSAMLVMAFFLLLHALQQGLLEPNLGEVVQSIRSGALDLVLMKPADAQLLVSARKVAPSRIWDVVAAIALMGWSLARLPAPSPLDVVVAAVMVVSGLAAIYGLWLLAICTSFYFVRVGNLRYLLMAATDAGRWPITVFRGWVRVLLTVVVPIAVITSFPAMALTGTWKLTTVVVAVVVASAFVAASRWAWVRSLQAYTSASS